MKSCEDCHSAKGTASHRFPSKEVKILDEDYQLEFEKVTNHTDNEPVPAQSQNQVNIEPRCEIVLPVTIRNKGIHVVEPNPKLKSGF